MDLLGDMGHVESTSLHLETVLASMQYSCTLCVEHTIGLEIGLDALDELLADVGLVESCFEPFGDSVSVDGRLVHGLRQTYLRLRHRF